MDTPEAPQIFQRSLRADQSETALYRWMYLSLGIPRRYRREKSSFVVAWLSCLVWPVDDFSVSSGKKMAKRATITGRRHRNIRINQSNDSIPQLWRTYVCACSRLAAAARGGVALPRVAVKREPAATFASPPTINNKSNKSLS